MAHVKAVERKKGLAYEVHWRQGTTKKQRTFTAKRAAERFALKVEGELAEGNSTEPLVKNAKTVAQVVQASMAASKPELKPRTFHSYELLYNNRILPTFGSRRVSTVTRADVQTWVTALAGEGLSSTTVHHHYVALKKAFRYAQHDRLISYNPCDGIKLPKNHEAEQFQSVFLNAAQVESLASSLSRSRHTT